MSITPGSKIVLRQKIRQGSSHFPSVNPKDEKPGTEEKTGSPAACRTGRERIHSISRPLVGCASGVCYGPACVLEGFSPSFAGLVPDPAVPCDQRAREGQFQPDQRRDRQPNPLPQG